jgi:hypothetical protein
MDSRQFGSDHLNPDKRRYSPGVWRRQAKQAELARNDSFVPVAGARDSF